MRHELVHLPYHFHPSSDSEVVRVLVSHAAVLGLIPENCYETLSKFPKILFVIEEQLPMLKFIIKCPNVIYYVHFPLPGDGFSTWAGIYIPLTLSLKECIQVRTKLSEGQLFTFRDQQGSCLPSAARLDSPEDQGKGKVGPRKVLFLQEYNFLQG